MVDIGKCQMMLIYCGFFKIRLSTIDSLDPFSLSSWVKVAPVPRWSHWTE